MNFYKHHIGDYGQATAHLTFVEDAAYSRLLRKYYAEERPISGTLESVQRLLGARTKEERKAVETVLAEFFIEEEDGWHNKRADEEVKQYQAQAENNRRIAQAREAKRRKEHSDEHDSLNDSLRVREPNHQPEPEPEPDKSSVPIHLSREACIRMKAAGCTRTYPSDPGLAEALSMGVTVAELEDAARVTVEEGLAQRNPFRYAVTMAINSRRQGNARAEVRADNGSGKHVEAGSRVAVAPWSEAVTWINQQHTLGQIDAAERARMIKAEMAKHPSASERELSDCERIRQTADAAQRVKDEEPGAIEGEWTNLSRTTP